MKTREPLAGGMAFGDVGAYERLNGVVQFAIDPKAAAYRHVVDLPLAATNPAGEVAFAAEFCLLKPVDTARGNRRILFDVINRGNIRALQFFNDAEPTNAPASAAHAGNGFLMRRGYTLAALAWQGDILPAIDRMSMQLPIAGSAQAPVTGLVRMELIADREGIVSTPLSGNDYTHNYPTISLDTRTAEFTRREYPDDPRQAIAPEDWQFAAVDANGVAVAAPTHCYLREGFRPGWIYELIYTAKDPLVLGLGFSGVRDFVSFLRHADRDDAGLANPLRSAGETIDRAYAWGRSQSGRFLREFVYRGWNEDARGRRVFDGVHPHVTGAGRVSLNYRFAQPGRYPRAHEDHLFPSDQFPFAYGLTTDPFSCQSDAILKRPNTDPLVIHSQTAAEYWQRRGSLVHTDAFGADMAEHPRARLYFFASSQHFAEPGGKAEDGPHRHLSNPLDTAPVLRALLDAMDAWSTYGTPPPASRIPRRADGSLVSAAEAKTRFPPLADVEYPDAPNRLHVTDYGVEIEAGRYALEPPVADAEREYAVLVPQVDADGNDIAGVRVPHLEAPLATHTGWNYRSAGSTRARYSIIGSFLPFARTHAEREASSDPRPSIEERYRSRADYVARIAVAAHALVAARLMLDEDLERYVARAINGSDFPS
jgi:hypothetical protein